MRRAATTVEVDAAPVLSYPMAHNRLPVVSRIAVHHTGPAVRGAVVQVEVRDVEGRVGTPWEQLVDLETDAQTVLTDVDLRLDPAAVLQIEEQRPAQVVVQVLGEGDLLAERTVHVDLLAPRQWLAVPPVLAMELLAAFVMPNHPAVGALVDEACVLLAERTGDASTAGYQQGPERVDATVATVLDAMTARGIRYSEPPASWSDVGQKVRTPEEVLDGRVGTCLDTVVTMAAALEHVGVRPLLWLVEGHAFLGYWREEAALAAIAQREVPDVAAVVNLVDLGLVRLVETTLVTARGTGEGATGAARSGPVTAAQAHDAAYTRWLTGDLARVLGVVDVWRARRAGVLPLPAHTRAADGTVTITEYRPGEDRTTVPQPVAVDADVRPAAAGTLGRAPVPPRVAQWKNSLLDLSLRNRLIHFTPRSGIPLAVPAGGLGSVEDALHDGRAVHLLPADQLDEVEVARGVTAGRELPAEQRAELFARRQALYTDLPAAGYATRLRGLAYKARTVVEETGANNLYLASGSLVWTLDGRELRSPLVLTPVRLVTRSREQAYRLELDETGASTPNYCLLEKLRQVHGLTVPGLAEPALDGAGIDVDAALLALRTALATEGLGYRVEETADLAILQFAKFRLWKDLDEHWDVLTQNPLVRHLVETPTAVFADPVPEPGAVDLDELAAACPVPADASQLDAVAHAVAGRTFVLEGPPGTGKSQTITNLLTRAVAEGRRVLFVAEKRAALDVVRARLDDVGMGPFSLDLHDKGSKPSAVRAQVRTALEHTVEVDDEGLAAEHETLRAARRALARYAERLHEPNGAGLSFYSARTSLLALTDGAGRRRPTAGTTGVGTTEVLPVPVELVTTGAPEVPALRRALELLPDTADPARPRPDHPWGFVGLTDPQRIDVAAVGRAVADVDAALAPARALSGTSATVLAAARTHEDLEVLADLGAAPPVRVETLDETRTERWRTTAARLVEEIAAFPATAAAEHPGLALAVPAVLDLPLTDLARRAQAAASSGWWGRRGRLLAVAAELQPGLQPGTTLKAGQVLPVTASLARVHTAVQTLAFRVQGLAGVTLPAGWNPLLPEALEAVQSQVAWLTWAGEAVDPDGGDPTADPFVRGLRAFVDDVARLPLLPADVAVLERLSRTTTALAATVQATTRQVARWSTPDGFVARWTATAAERVGGAGAGFDDDWTSAAAWGSGAAGDDDPDGPLPVARPAVGPGIDPLPLERWVAFVGALEPLRRARLTSARELLLVGAVAAPDAVRALDRGLAIASARERRTATGLDGFDPVAHGRAIGRFLSSAAAVRDHQRTALPRDVTAARPFDASSAQGDVGGLVRELARQRGGLGVRGLMATYGELITQVMPCVLVSPDSLARFFPARAGLFDLVVFDEASQIRVADAVGAMGRARSVVVVGDSKQMPPTSFAEVTGGGDEEPAEGAADAGLADGLLEGVLTGALAVEDEESILSECVQARVPRRWLSWHYRSQDESLIAFSNHQYYEDRLSSFPAPTSGAADPGPGGYGVSLVRVDGTFHRTARRGGPGQSTAGLLRTNPVEAQAVVDEIRRRFDAAPDGLPSIGVVTFNAPQRALIEALLRDSGDERLADALERSGSPGGSDEGLFVKNLENVQGDERDTILFSTAFSVNERGYLPLNFGPLNRDGGERRLNVAVTRARRQVVVFSSFDPEQLRAEETQSVGIKHLRAYLDLAASRSRATTVPARRSSAVDRHREQVAEALRERGLAVRTDVGLSDFRVDLALADAAAPERPLVAVLLDGPGWAARRTVGDRDGLPTEVLSRMLRWPAVERVWLPAWLATPGDVLDHLVGSVERAAADAATRDDATPA
ncbi:DNA helicase [Cellulomonas cellasea]|uniref:DNA helicase n=1 Tax=Cellulomonas cellasea TaxID=43670 RepID=A0A4Y3KST7_9CELL|nr:DNA helicase [Cellulomonas cellasea]